MHQHTVHLLLPLLLLAALRVDAAPNPEQAARRVLEHGCNDGIQSACDNLAGLNRRPPAIEAPNAPSMVQASEAVSAAQVTASRTYRAEVVAIDAAAIVVMLAGLSDDSGVVTLSGFAIWAAGNPALHLSHDNPGRAALSFGLRTAAPLALAFLGSRCNDPYSDPEDPPDCGEEQAMGAAMGLVGGALVALTIEHVFLVPSAREMPTARRVSPTLSAHPTGLALGLGGSF